MQPKPCQPLQGRRTLRLGLLLAAAALCCSLVLPTGAKPLMSLLPLGRKNLDPATSSTTAKPATGSSSSSTTTTTTIQPTVLGVQDGDQAAGIQLAARQTLFDYATQVGLAVLQQHVQQLSIPDASKTFNLPIVGNFQLQLSAIRVAQFNVSQHEAQLEVRDGLFYLTVNQVATQLTFTWHWEKLGLSGTGEGELSLEGGTISYACDVKTEEVAHRPQLEVQSADATFDSVELKIHSRSADWLYQAVLSLFNDAIKARVVSGIDGALANDVPEALNRVLATLPTHVVVTGLPFNIAFDYSIYTTAYVLVKGYGEVQVPDSDSPEGGPVMVKCPFDTTPLPLDKAGIEGDSTMITLYVHESTINCMLWGLYREGMLKYSLTDGKISGLHLTTDLLAMLIPALPKAYPKMYLRLDVESLGMPSVAFAAATPGGSSVTVHAVYRTSIYVANDTLGNPLIATVNATLDVQADVEWDSITINDVQVHHQIEYAADGMAVSAGQWDATVGWALQSYGGLFPLSKLVEAAIKAPVDSLVLLSNTRSATYDHWFGLSSDVRMRNAPAVAAAATKGAGTSSRSSVQAS